MLTNSKPEYLYRKLNEMLENCCYKEFDSSNRYYYNSEDGKIQIKINLAGYKKEDISVSLEDKELFIKAVSNENWTQTDYNKKFIIAKQVDEDNINLTFEDGILTIDMKFKDSVKKLKIS